MTANSSEEGSASHKPAQFATTHWSVVLTAGHSGAPDAEGALEALCQAYWYPLYVYVRRRGYGVEEAQDLTQEFFARLIGKHWLAEADARKGRFRNFLLTALNHFLANEWHRSHAAKRGGGQVLIALDDTAEARYAQEPVSHQTPERIYERHWALSVFDRALERLRERYAATGRVGLHDRLMTFLSVDAAEGEYARVGKELEMSAHAVAMAVHRLRQQYRDLVREEVAHTVQSPAELEEEIRWLLQALS